MENKNVVIINNETGDTIDNWYTNRDIPTSLMVDIVIDIPITETCRIHPKGLRKLIKRLKI